MRVDDLNMGFNVEVLYDIQLKLQLQLWAFYGSPDGMPSHFASVNHLATIKVNALNARLENETDPIVRERLQRELDQTMSRIEMNNVRAETFRLVRLNLLPALEAFELPELTWQEVQALKVNWITPIEKISDPLLALGFGQPGE